MLKNYNTASWYYGFLRDLVCDVSYCAWATTLRHRCNEC